MAAMATITSMSTSAIRSLAAPKPGCALPSLHRSRVAYGVPGSTTGRRRARGPTALFGGGEKGTGEKKPEKKFITREEEPEQYWTTAAEREGKNPMQTVLPYIFLLTLLSPFAILAVAYTQGWIKMPN